VAHPDACVQQAKGMRKQQKYQHVSDTVQVLAAVLHTVAALEYCPCMQILDDSGRGQRVGERIKHRIERMGAISR